MFLTCNEVFFFLNRYKSDSALSGKGEWFNMVLTINLNHLQWMNLNKQFVFIENSYIAGSTKEALINLRGCDTGCA